MGSIDPIEVLRDSRLGLFPIQITCRWILSIVRYHSILASDPAVLKQMQM